MALKMYFFSCSSEGNQDFFKIQNNYKYNICEIFIVIQPIYSDLKYSVANIARKDVHLTKYIKTYLNMLLITYNGGEYILYSVLCYF